MYSGSSSWLCSFIGAAPIAAIRRNSGTIGIRGSFRFNFAAYRVRYSG